VLPSGAGDERSSRAASATVASSTTPPEVTGAGAGHGRLPEPARNSVTTMPCPAAAPFVVSGTSPATQNRRAPSELSAAPIAPSPTSPSRATSPAATTRATPTASSRRGRGRRARGSGMVGGPGDGGASRVPTPVRCAVIGASVP
jgi:hypothetical protein